MNFLTSCTRAMTTSYYTTYAYIRVRQYIRVSTKCKIARKCISLITLRCLSHTLTSCLSALRLLLRSASSFPCHLAGGVCHAACSCIFSSLLLNRSVTLFPCHLAGGVCCAAYGRRAWTLVAHHLFDPLGSTSSVPCHLAGRVCCAAD